MNDRLPIPNATSLANQPALPESWVSKIFAKLEARYGSLFHDRWRGCDMDNIRETWAEELAGFRDRPESIGYALRTLADQQFPPTLPEFLAACRRAPVKARMPALEHKPTAEEREHHADIARRLGDIVGAGRIRGGIDEHWATHPKTEIHLRYIFDAARNDARFKQCVAQMVADGVCSEDGKLLRRYRGMGQWEKAAA